MNTTPELEHQSLQEKRKRALHLLARNRSFRAFPLSYGQRRLWVLDQLSDGLAAYNLTAAFHLEGNCSYDTIRATFAEIVRRHDVLRTRLRTRDGELVQEVTTHVALDIELEAMSPDRPREERRSLIIEDFVHAEASHSFDLSSVGLLRVRVLRCGELDHVLVVCMHHIISDGWSVGVLMREFAELYSSLVEGRPSTLKDLPIQYGDYAVWQRNLLTGDLLEKRLAYWREQLAGMEPLRLATDHARPAIVSYRGGWQQFRLGEAATAHLRALSRQHGTTLFMTLLAALQAMLSRETGQTDIAIGSVIANRNRSELEDLIGFFVNTIVLRTALDGDPSFADILGRVRKTTLGAYAHQDVPFEKLVEELEPTRDLSRQPLFQVMFVLQNAPVQAMELSGVQVSELRAELGGAKFDLTFTLAEAGAELEGELEYAADLFEPETAQRLIKQYVRVLEQVAVNAQLPLSELRLLSAEERALLIEGKNQTAREYESDLTVHALFERQAAAQPHACAIEWPNGRWSYEQLNQRANQLAHTLRAKGVGPETRVAVAMERSPEMIAALLAILKAGGTYVPLDPDYPQQRLRYMLEDVEAHLLLTDRTSQPKLPKTTLKHLLLDQDLDLDEHQNQDQGHAQAQNQVQDENQDIDQHASNLSTTSNPHPNTNPNNAAYIIYTSGSTGNPKGVLIQHRQTVAMIHWALETTPFHARQSVLFSTSLCFDLSIYELFLPLSGGGQVHISENLLAWQGDASATLINTVPSLAKEWLSSAQDNRLAHFINLAGEPLPATLVQQLRSWSPHITIYNLYGPTECTTYSTVAKISEGDASPSIGKPIANTTVYILDSTLEPVPQGVSGELYIGGAGVALGYLNKSDVTAARFVPDCFSRKAGSRMYRTGDVARWRSSGELEFLGRIDHQVKIRGLRIELGEIEAAISVCPNVTSVVVDSRVDRRGESILVAYVVPGDLSHGIDINIILDDIREKLPAYMVPSKFISIDHLPLTLNGKLDRRALPDPDYSVSPVEHVDPRTAIEEMLTQIWGSVLGIDTISIDSNFFELGGHSLLATQVMSRVQKRFGVNLPLRLLFERPSVRGLAEAIRLALFAPVSITREKALPLSYQQQRLWFVDQLAPGRTAFNITGLVRITGELQPVLLVDSLRGVLERHEILRSAFPARDGQPIQVVSSNSDVKLTEVDLSWLPREESEEECAQWLQEEAARPFDLAAGPLLRIGLIRLNPSSHMLIVSMHRMVADEWSLGILLGELASSYEAYSSGASPNLGEVHLQYADYAAWQRTYLKSEVLERELAYWRRELAGVEPLALPTDHPRPAVVSHRGAWKSFHLDSTQTEALTHFSSAEGVTLFVTLLATLQILIGRYGRQQDFTIGTETPNRKTREMEGLIGFFANTLVLRTNLADGDSFLALLHKVHERTLGAYAYQDIPFEKIVTELEPERDLSRQPLFQVMLLVQEEAENTLVAGDITIAERKIVTSGSKYDLTFSFTVKDSILQAQVEYAADLYEEETIGSLIRHYQNLLVQVVAEPSFLISDLRLLEPSEELLLVHGKNRTQRDFPDSLCLSQIFEEQAACRPAELAVTFGARQLSYDALDRSANQIGNALISLGVRSGSRVGICMKRSDRVMAAFLGVLKAGAAYVPLDPDYPEERLRYLLTDANVSVILSETSLLHRLPDTKADVLAIDVDDERLISQSDEKPELFVGPASAACVLYTSGSTGQPKGVLITHRGVARLVRNSDYVRFEPHNRVSQISSISFDAATFEIWGALLNGASLHVFPFETVVDPVRLGMEMVHARIDTALITTALFNRMIDVAPQQLATISTVVFGGEAGDAQRVSRFMASGATGRLINAYGPTEGTTISTWHEVLSGSGVETISIGLPMSNTEVYLLDTTMQPVPSGIVGEIYIGGAGIAIGYLDRPASTADLFVPDPFSGRPGSRLYRTGDLARWNLNGLLDFISRDDDQVKIRGHRIELGEIEAVLRTHASIRDSLVLAREDKPREKRLVAYILQFEEQATARELRDYLRSKLPSHLVPTAILTLDEWPLTPNGKVNKKALPKPDLSAQTVYVAPQTYEEEVLCGIWQQVLNVPRVGSTDNFFELGGHSLLATQVMSRLRKVLSIEAPLRALFDAPTVAGLALRLANLREAELNASVSVIPHAPRGVDQPLSYAQQRLWFIEQLAPGSALYNMPFALRLQGPLNVDVLRWSLDEIVRRHEVLRTHFPEHDGDPVARVTPARGAGLEVVLVAPAKSDREEAVSRLIQAEIIRGFNLATGPVLRAMLLEAGPEDHVLLVTMHHIAGDGWSMGVLLKEFTQLYRAHGEHLLSPLPDPEIQYCDFSVWQRQWLQGGVLDQQLGYWSKQLQGIKALELPTDFPRATRVVNRGVVLPFRVSSELTGSLKELSRSEGATLFMVLLATLQILLSRWTSQKDVSVGTVIANRNRAETEELIGFFVNTLVLRADLNGEPTFREVLAQSRKAALDAYAHQDVPFEKLVEELEPERDLTRQPLFQVMLVLQNAPLDEMEIPGLHISRVNLEVGEAKFDLGFTFTEGPDGLEGELEFAEELFQASTMNRLSSQYQRILEQVVHDADVPISALRILSDYETSVLTRQKNLPLAVFPVSHCIHQLIEEHARKSPEAIAIIFEDTRLSYSELNRQANQIANVLSDFGVGPESRVGVCFERSSLMIAALLGILKAGATYVPLDPEYPADRLAYLVEDSGIHLLLAHSSVRGKIPHTSAQVLVLDESEHLMAEAGLEDPLNPTLPENAAYVIYTSGSTGRPKGVVVTHKNVVRLFSATEAWYDFGPRDVWTVFHSFAFDFSVWEIWGCLSYGGRLVVISRTTSRSSDQFYRLLHEHQVTVLNQTPSAFLQLQQVDQDLQLPLSLRAIIFGGEALNPGAIMPWSQRHPSTRLINMYGITETSVHTTYKELSQLDLQRQGSSPIGTRIPDVQVYILDEWLQPVPPGASGELFVAGAGLARGYLNQPYLTAERFVPHPFSDAPGARLYRTGDLARWSTASGDIEYLGRSDQQVKIRGFRIELGEIESAIRTHPSVREAAVLAVEEDRKDKRLVAYYILCESGLADIHLRTHLQHILPDYMVPASLIEVEVFPLTMNGKLDRQLLQKTQAQPAKPTAAPSGVEEEILCGIWSQLLEVQTVGVDDNFFELGGHSLLATQLMSRVRKILHTDLPLRLLFERPTVNGLAEEIRLRAGEENSAISQPIIRRTGEGITPLSHSQQRLWFLYELVGGAAYNITGAIRLSGDLSLDAVKTAFEVIVSRHEILRTYFLENNGSPYQGFLNGAFENFQIVDLTASANRNEEANQIVHAEASHSFDLSSVGLLRVRVLRCGELDHVLVVCMHHIISDGWSVGVLMREFAELYSSLVEGRPSTLKDLPIQYGDYAVWQRNLLTGDLLEKRLAYWREQLAGMEPLRLATDHARPAIVSYRGGWQQFRLGEAATAHLRALSRQHGTTLFMTLLAALQAMLSRETGQTDIAIGSVIANRNRSELEDLIGFFVNTIVLRTALDGDPSFADILGRVRKTTLGAYAHQDVPFEKLVEELEPTRDLSRQPLFQVMFVLQNAPVQAMELSGVQVSELRAELGGAKFDLTFTLAEAGAELEGELEYAADLFEPETAQRLIKQYVRVLEQVAVNAQLPLSELRLLSAEERALLIEGKNQTAREYESDLTVHALFERQAAAQPHACAIEWPNGRWSYEQLNQRANQLAHTLRAKGVGPETRVAVAMERSPEMIAALLAILKAGGTYVPLDPDYPQQRLRYMLEDVEAHLLLTDRTSQPKLPKTTLKHLLLDQDLDLDEHQNQDQGHAQAQNQVQDENQDIDQHASNLSTTSNPHPNTNPNNAAYIIYTSGSTGNPKGVLIQHRSITRLVRNTDYVQLSPSDRVAHASNVSFDAATFEIWGALLNGASMIVFPYEVVVDPVKYGEELKHKQVTTLFTTTALFNSLVDYAPEALASIRNVLWGGEAADASRATRLLQTNPPRRLLHVYGPTETTTFATSLLLDKQSYARTVPIGLPIANTEVFLLDTWLEPVPPGVPGELYLGGPGLARGYWNQSEMTATRFVPHPFSQVSGDRLYRTGDMLRWNEDGQLDFIGRFDGQIKIRGFRIELGEIESTIRQYSNVLEAVASVRQGPLGTKQVVAYVLWATGATGSFDTLREHLKALLPDYMVPTIYVSLENVPLTPNGKVDRNALPSPDILEEPETPNRSLTAVEAIVSTVWQDLLGRSFIDVNTTFFELGGHSLLATQAVAQIRSALAIDLPLRVFFANPTVRDLAAAIEHQRRSTIPPLTSAARIGSIPLSYAQERLWFMDRLEPGSPAYNIPLHLHLAGPLDRSALSLSLNEVIRRHEILRTTISFVDGSPVQIITPSAPFTFKELNLCHLTRDLQDEEVKRVAREVTNQSFDLEAGPLMQCTLVQLAPEEHVLFITMHHIICDGWSLSVLTNDFSQLYISYKEGVQPTLEEPRIQYADYAIWQREWLRGDVLEGELAYWRKQLQDVAVLQLPVDASRAAILQHAGAWIPVQVDSATTAKLKDLTRQQGATLFILLLAVLQIVLGNASSEDDVAVGADIANRNATGTAGLVGFFVNQLVLRSKLVWESSFGDFLKRVRETAIEAFTHQDLPFEKLVEHLDPDRGVNGSPFFQSKLVFLNLPEMSLRMDQVTVNFEPPPTETAKLELTVTLEEAGNELVGSFNYRADLFRVDTINLLRDQYVELLHLVCINHEITLDQLRESLIEMRRSDFERRREDRAGKLGQRLQGRRRPRAEGVTQ